MQRGQGRWPAGRLLAALFGIGLALGLAREVGLQHRQIGALAQRVRRLEQAVPTPAPRQNTVTKPISEEYDARQALELDADIDDLRTSPDSSRFGLLLRRLLGAERPVTDYRLSLAIFERSTRRLVGEQPLGSMFNPILGWSPDGRWLAASGGGPRSVFLLGINGEKRALSLPCSVGHLVWQDEKPSTRFVYSSAELPYQVREHDLTTDRDRLLDARRYCIGLFRVRGRVCLGYLGDKRGTPARSTTVFAARLGERPPFLRIPMADNTDWDSYRLDLSPGSDYFLLSRQASAGVRNIIARTVDAATVLGRPLQAILWQDTIEEPFYVRWPRKARDIPDPIVTVGPGRLRFLLNLHTGSRTPGFYGWKETRVMDFCDRERLALVNGTGLVTTEWGTASYPNKLLIHHTLIPEGE